MKLILTACLCATVTAAAQQASPSPEPPLQTLTLQTRLVTLAATVQGKKGVPARGLTKDDFTLKEDGKEQQIRYFSEGSELPLTLALMVDTSGSQRNFILDETKASELFFPQMLKAREDRAVLVQFDNNVLQLQRMTNSVYDLERGLLHLTEPHASALPGARGGTMLFDAIVLTAKVVIGKELGRRAMVILTDGGDNGSQFSLEQAIASAQQADTTIYAVYYSADDGMGFRQNYGRDVCKKLAEQTGGKVYTVTDKMTLQQIYTDIAETLRLQYVMAYRPPDTAPGSYHKLQLKPKDKHLTVQSRTGYYTPKAPRESTPAAAASKP